MATIGTFKQIGEGEYLGDIFTLTLNLKGVRIVPVAVQSDKAPTHRVHVRRTELGAAWSKRSQGDRDYLSLKLDDPSFNAPIYASLVEDEGGETHSLVWNRPAKRD